MKRFISRWGNLDPLQLPSSMMQGRVLSLRPIDLKVLIVLLYLHKSRFRRRKHDETIASVKVGQKALVNRTGCPRAATISEAVHRLQAAGFIQIVRDRAGSTRRGTASSEYILLDPDTSEPLKLTRGSNIFGSLGIKYFTIPIVLLTSVAHWSLAKLSGSETRLYIAMLWMADVERSHRFERTNAQLYRTAGITLPTFKKALEGLRRHGLIFTSEDEAIGVRVIHLCDPFTGEPMHSPDGDDANDPANYTVTDANGVVRRFSWNGGTKDQWEQIVRACVPAGEPIIKRADGELMIRCPFHEDRNPSCSVSLEGKRCYNCFGCPKPGGSGTLTALLAKLTGTTKGDTIRRIAPMLGAEVNFNEPDSKAIATYDYRDARGILVKRVLRFPNDENGNKRFSQRRWTDSGWIPDVKGVGPVLYNAHRLLTAGTVVIVEGEKDANSITDLHLDGHDGETIGVTSGGSGSWHAKLAKQFRDKAVIVMPDNDAAGESYAEAVRGSLDAESVRYKTVSFAGTGAKDVTEYIENGQTVEKLVQLIDSNWVRMPRASLQDIPIDDDFVPA
jgi:5S rRNA maturation endonuclease (ribonuclease M5)